MAQPILVDAATAAVHLARIYDPGDPYDGTPVPPERIAQWVSRIYVWAHRHPTELRKHRAGRHTLYDLDELVRLAERKAIRASLHNRVIDCKVP